MTPDQILPAKIRKVVYLIFAVLALAGGAARVGYQTAGLAIPTWLVVAIAVYAFVAAAPLTIAVLNINPADPNLVVADPSEGEGAIEPDELDDPDEDAPPVEDPVEDVPAVASPDAAPRT